MPVLHVSKWPKIDASVDARVVAIDPVGERTVVTFEAPHDGRHLRWLFIAEDPQWELGERRRMYLDDGRRIHVDQQLGVAGVPLLLPVLMTGLFGCFAVRRLWALAVAQWDLARGDDEPSLGYGALIDDPAPKTYRPLLAVWRDDPTGRGRLPEPDAVYRADDETAEDLQCRVDRIVVRRAWIDTGPWPMAKPRWVGFEEGVAVPHRRSLFGRWYVRRVTKRSDVDGVVPIRHGPPVHGLSREWVSEEAVTASSLAQGMTRASSQSTSPTTAPSLQRMFADQKSPWVGVVVHAR